MSETVIVIFYSDLGEKRKWIEIQRVNYPLENVYVQYVVLVIDNSIIYKLMFNASLYAYH